ncbi:LacI family DNA-binding transcriptional regulator [Mucilaginibacter sp. PAMB04168]|uniref:LacI family DNA-binding transcriptional regulator n=1 Tax=Mucilaginibacter sp. PAMB04168 TaxID=3138567 RepID=UPI0031F673C2
MNHYTGYFLISPAGPELKSRMEIYKEVTIYDIAKQLNLSAATVSRALANHSSVGQISKSRVQKMARQMGYRTNFLASNLRKQRSNTIGVIVPRLNSCFISDVIAGIEQTIYQANYNLIISQSLETLDKEIKNAESMYKNRVDGLLASLSNETRDIDHFNMYSKRNIPVVFFDKTPANSNFTTVSTNNIKAAYHITQHLIEQGCRRIVHVTSNKIHSVYIDRFKGYRQALSDNHIPYEPQMVVTTSLNAPDPIAIIDRTLALSKQADAIFATNDLCAVACIKELKARGLSVPNDIAIAGFNNDPLSRIIEPNLTTVNYKGNEMGQTAARELLKYLDESAQQSMEPNRLCIDSEVVVRASSLIR